MSLLDEEGVTTPLSLLEISGPWYIANNTHFLKDKKKIANDLKFLINHIYLLNNHDGSNIKKIKLYGVQVYQKSFYVYSLQLIAKKLYVFKEELKFDYPTSPSIFRSKLPVFIKNMLKLQILINLSMDNVLMFLNDDETSPSQEETERYIDNVTHSPQKKK